MAGFVIGLLEPDHTGHITTIGIAPEHRRRRLASSLMERIEDGFRRRDVRIVRLEVRASNISAQKLYLSLGYSGTQRIPEYLPNGRGCFPINKVNPLNLFPPPFLTPGGAQ